MSIWQIWCAERDKTDEREAVWRAWNAQPKTS